MKLAKRKLIVMLMALLGMGSSCKDPWMDEPDMYGCPPTDYNDTLTGDSTQNNNTIENEK